MLKHSKVALIKKPKTLNWHSLVLSRHHYMSFTMLGGIKQVIQATEEHVLDTNAGKQLF